MASISMQELNYHRVDLTATQQFMVELQWGISIFELQKHIIRLGYAMVSVQGECRQECLETMLRLNTILQEEIASNLSSDYRDALIEAHTVLDCVLKVHR